MGIGELRGLARRGCEAASEIAGALERFPGLSPAVLEVANRTCGRRMATVDRAVVVLGSRAVIEIALALLPRDPGLEIRG
jgi:HD-like signal output (HDOD) protein